VFLLDAYDSVYVWLGHEARSDEKSMAMDAALVVTPIIIRLIFANSTDVSVNIFCPVDCAEFCAVRIIVKMRTFIASNGPTSEALTYGTHCEGFPSFTCTPTCLFANGVNLAFCLSSQSWSSFY